MRRFVLSVAAVLLAATFSHAAEQDARFFHCMQNWSAEALGETCMSAAAHDGYPAELWSAEPRNAPKAYNLCAAYFPWVSHMSGVARAHVCMSFAEYGAEGLAGW
jgi:hypothetical protein